MDGFWVVKEVVLMNFFKQVPQYMLCLQNGRFDHPDRMFNSISDTWRNVTTDAADFKELIPEFYDPACNGDFLVNSLNLDFGKRQNGCAVGDVELPQWAQGPAHFIRTCREALESSFVSENLHDWIDLIFGYKQTGEEAVLADNVYYHLTYEGSVDLDSIQDIYERHSLEVQIMEFGQTPKQIFKHPHPQRCCTVLPRSLSMASDSCPDSLLENVSSIPEELETRDRAPSISSFAWKRNMADLTKMAEHMLHKEMVTHVCFSSSKSSVFSVSQDSLLKLYSLEQKQQLRSVNISHMALSSCIVMDDKTVVVGSWDNYVYVYNMEYGRITESTLGHEDAVSDLSWKNGVLATASWDSTAKIWKLVAHGDKSGCSLLAELEHESGVACIALDAEGEHLVSGTVEGCVSLWKLQGSTCIGQFDIHKGTVSAVSFSPDGHRIASCSEDKMLKVLDVPTGTVLFSKNAGWAMRCLCWDGATVLTGCDSGSILVWDLLSAKLVATVSAHSGPVTCIHVCEDGSLIATGGSDGKVVVWQSAEP